MDRTRLLTIAVIGLLLLNAGILATMFFHRPPGPRMDGGRPPGPREIIIERLHLDKAQQDQYELLIREHRDGMDRLDAERRELKNKLYGMLKDGSSDTLAVNAAIRAIGKNEEEKERISYMHFQKIRELCKPDQMADFNALAGDLARIFAPQGPPPPPR